MKNSVPCTSCRYCCDGCPAGLEIPKLLAILNDMRFAPVVNTSMLVEAMPEEKRPSACISCGKCTKICPQGIDVPALMGELTDRLAKLPSWAEVSRQREEEQKKNQE
jgi:predicted aldo/keto reductase-like oxidoreductase